MSISKVTPFRRELSAHRLANVMLFRVKAKKRFLSQKFPKFSDLNDRRDFGTSRRNFRCSVSVKYLTTAERAFKIHTTRREQ